MEPKDICNEEIRLVSAEGDIFQVQLSEKWAESSLIRSLFEDSRLDEDIPLPSSTSRGLTACLELLRQGPSPIEKADTLLLEEILWVAKLLDMLATITPLLVDLLGDGVFGEWPFVAMPVNHLVPFLSCAESMPQSLVSQLLEACSSRAEPVHYQAVTKGFMTLLGSKVWHDFSLGALQRLPFIGAKVALLASKDFSVRATAVKDIKALLPVDLAELKLVVRLTQHPSFLVREHAVMALAEAAPKGEHTIILSLLPLLEDVREVRVAATSALKHLILKDDAWATQQLMEKFFSFHKLGQCAALEVLACVAPSINESVLDMAMQAAREGCTLSKMQAYRLVRMLEGSQCHDHQGNIQTQRSSSSCDQDSPRERTPRSSQAWSDLGSDPEWD